MATRRQKKANRKNAKRSTGPRTPEGKARSSLNASKHGLFARDTVLPEENPQEFLELIAELEQELEAVGGFECRLVRHIADAEWRMRRIVRLETGALTHQLEKERLCVRRIQAELGKLPPALQPKPYIRNQDVPSKPSEEEQPRQPETDGQNENTLAEPVEPKNETADTYGQTTRELGSAIEAYRDSPVLLTLSLYESRLNRKYQSLIKQLRLTQKLRHAEAVECDEATELQREPIEPQPLPSETQDQPSRIEGEVAGSTADTETRPLANQPPHPPTAAADELTPSPDAGQVDRTPATSENTPPRGPTRISPQIAVHV